MKRIGWKKGKTDSYIVHQSTVTIEKKKRKKEKICERKKVITMGSNS